MRPQEEIDRIKRNILNVALDIIVKEGYSALSMRKLASHLDMTAANLYNYYSCKEGIILDVKALAYETLYQTLKPVSENISDPYKQIEGYLKNYLNFGFENPAFYEIMYSMISPRFADYTGSELEEMALILKKKAMDILGLLFKSAEKLPDFPGDLTPNDIRVMIFHYWGAAHGLVSLHNNRMLSEFPDSKDTKSLVEEITQELYTACIADIERHKNLNQNS